VPTCILTFIHLRTLLLTLPAYNRNWKFALSYYLPPLPQNLIMPLFGRHRARNDAPRRGGWTLFSRNNRSTNPNTTSTILPNGRNRDTKRSRRTARSDARGARVPLATRVKRKLGIQSTPRRTGILGRVDDTSNGQRRGLFSGGTSTSRRRGRRGGNAGSSRGCF